MSRILRYEIFWVSTAHPQSYGQLHHHGHLFKRYISDSMDLETNYTNVVSKLVYSSSDQSRNRKRAIRERCDFRNPFQTNTLPPHLGEQGPRIRDLLHHSIHLSHIIRFLMEIYLHLTFLLPSQVRFSLLFCIPSKILAGQAFTFFQSW